MISYLTKYNKAIIFRIFDFEESDSDFVNEQLTGNIHKIAIVPTNYSGKPKKGHLIFDARFECGTWKKLNFIQKL